MASLPRPPLALANRVGSLAGSADPWATYDALGAGAKAAIERLLPAGWQWSGKRVLDFGCGAGRTLRQFAAEAAVARFAGCDIDADSVAWLQANLSPPFHAFGNGEHPPLAVADRSFDLVYAVSVFSHLGATWSAWLAELHRVLDDDGLAVLTFMGEGQAQWLGVPWDEDRIGMLVLREEQGWDDGGPMVLHAPWWIREHWGRAFEIVVLAGHGFGLAAPDHDEPRGQGAVVLRKRPGQVTADELEAIDGNVEREARALAYALSLVRAERDAARDEAYRWKVRHDTMAASHSWQLTRPLRAVSQRIRRPGA